MTTVAQEVYEALTPGWTARDDGQLLDFVEAITQPLETVWEIVQSDFDLLFQVDDAPPEVLDYIAQFAGVTYPVGSDDATKRTAITAHAGFARGRPASIAAEAQMTLTGSKTVVIREREGGPYRLQVRTVLDETPDEAATLAAILRQKPAGILLDYEAISGRDYADLAGDFATYADLTATGDTYDEVASTPL